MNSQFSRFGLLAVLVALLLSANAVAETRYVTEGTVINSRYSTDMASTDTVEINGGTFVNGIEGFDERSIANITVYSGIGRNERGSTVTGFVDVRAGEFANEGTVNRGTVSGDGVFMNNVGGIILGSLLMNGGTVNNGGVINNLIYGGAGTYNVFSGGSIGNLSLYAERQFDVNGLAGIANTFGVSRIDLAGANLVWNLSGSLGDNLGFFGWGDIFGDVNYVGLEDVALFTVNLGDAFTVFNADNFGQWQSFGGGRIIATMDGVTVTPEPATLAMVGLGLVGLGWARRRKY